MRRFRYRTPVLAGPWRATRDQALRDALAARQARAEEDAPSGIRWLVPGSIEEETVAKAKPAGN